MNDDEIKRMREMIADMAVILDVPEQIIVDQLERILTITEYHELYYYFNGKSQSATGALLGGREKI